MTSLETLADNMEITTKSIENITFSQVTSQNIAMASVKQTSYQNISIMLTENEKEQPEFTIDSRKESSNEVLMITTPETLHEDVKKLGTNSTVNRINVVFFKKSSFFPLVAKENETKIQKKLLSNVFSIKIGKLDRIKLSTNITWSIKLLEKKSKEGIECVYWDTGTTNTRF